MGWLSIVLRRFSGTRFDAVPLVDLIPEVFSGMAIGISDVRIGAIVNGNISVSFFWAGVGQPEIPDAYIARFGLARVP